MIDLKEVITKYPECLESSEKLRAYLTDLYPNEKAKVSIIVAIFNCGIADEIKNMKTIDEMALSRFCNRLENEFGFSQKLVRNCLELWTTAYGNNIQVSLPQKENKRNNNPQKEVKTTKTSSAKNKGTNSNRYFVIENGILKQCKRSKDKCTTIDIPEGVTCIGKGAFNGFYSLKNVNIPNSVLHIEFLAFSHCNSLTSIYIPNGVKTIESSAFAFCLGIKKLYISETVESIGQGAFSSNKLEEIVVSPDNPVYHSSNNCLIETKTKELVLGCKNSVIPADGSVETIKDKAFYFCSDLENIDIPNGIKNIRIGAFWGCDKMKSVHIPDSIEKIDAGAFSSNKLEKITVSKNNPSYYSCNNCLIETKTRTLVLGCENSIIPKDKNLYKIGNYAFHSCENIEIINIPHSIRKIGEYAFSGCSKLKKLTIECGVKKIEDHAFNCCCELEDIYIPNSVTNIRNGAFRRCEKITSITIPDSVIYIGNEAFDKCENLTKIIIPNSVERIGFGAFDRCGNLTIYATKSSVAEKYAIDNHIRFSEIK